MTAAGRAQNPAFTGGLVLGSTPVARLGQVHLITWQGVGWSPAYLFNRLVWLMLALSLTLLSVPAFDRFDQSAQVKEARAKRSKTAKEAAIEIGLPPEPTPIPAVAKSISPAHLTSVRLGSQEGLFARLTLAELRLLFKGAAWWWYLVAAGLLLGQILAPLEQSRGIWLALAWAWPLLFWSQLGAREKRYNTGSLLFSTPSPHLRRLFAAWLAGLALALVTGSGAAVRMAAAGEWAGLLGWLVSALWIPSLALALGTWSGSSKPFEVIYLVWWYLGPMNEIPALDFVHSGGGYWITYLLAVILLLGISFSGRVYKLIRA